MVLEVILSPMVVLTVYMCVAKLKVDKRSSSLENGVGMAWYGRRSWRRSSSIGQHSCLKGVSNSCETFQKTFHSTNIFFFPAYPDLADIWDMMNFDTFHLLFC